jgi:poly(3-hydroxybutyrate) depolymerase
MALGPWRTVKGRTHSIARLGCSLPLVMALGAARARADVALVPAEDGQLGAWLVAGPLPGAFAPSGSLHPSPRSGESLGGSAAAARWRMVPAEGGVLNLVRALEVKEHDGARAIVTGGLVLEENLVGWLLLSADGGVAAWVDGQPLLIRDADRLRDRSWDVLPVNLASGTHQLMIALHQRGPRWALGCRILDRADMLPPKHLKWVLPGGESNQTARLAAKLLEVTIRPGIDRDGYHPQVELAFPGGFPAGPSAPVTVSARPNGSHSNRWEVRLGDVVVSDRGVHPWAARLPRLPPEPGGDSGPERRWDFVVEVGQARQSRSLSLSPAAPEAFRRAEDTQRALREGRIAGLLDARAVDATLELWRERLQETASVTSRATPTETVRRLDDWLSMLEKGHDPLKRPGISELARWSKLDGHPTPMFLHVPGAYARGEARRYPLVVLLHGYDGNPQRIMRAFLGSERGASVPKVDGFLVAPHAHGNAFYRGPGEQDVLDTIDWMLEHYPIDPDRVSVTGVSMGGTGAAHLALLHADRFSRAAPLCGYQSYFIRRDIGHQPTRPWEVRRMHHWSPASWAANGRYVPLWVAQGTRDLPLANSRVLVDAYRALGYTVTDEWPDTGHAVWEKTYAGARLWPWLTGSGRKLDRDHVTLTTDALRYGKLDWVRVTALGPADKLGRIDVERTGRDRVVVKTDGVTGFELERNGARLDATAVQVDVDGTVLRFTAREALVAHRDPAGWHPGPQAPSTHDKRAGVEGPIDDAYLGPLVFVYGSLDPGWARANREVASTLARMRSGVQIHYPVVSDRDLDRALGATHSLVLVGNAQSHALIRELESRLPIQVVGDAIRLGDRSFSGLSVGTTFVYPNPEHPDHYVVMVEGAGVPGLYYALSLPQLLPDFSVYDASVALAAGQQILGAGRVLAAGFFQRDWSLPADSIDPMGASASSGAPSK